MHKQRSSITDVALFAGDKISSIDVNFNNIGSRMQDSIYHMLLNRTETLKSRFRKGVHVNFASDLM